MLPPFIIEHIKRREAEERRHDSRPRVHLPLPIPASPAPKSDEDEGERGVIVIDVL